MNSETGFGNNLCPIEATLRVIGKKWTLLILRELFNGRHRFSEFAEALPISTKLLAQRLRELEQFGIITRTTYPQVPPRVEYTLTDSGQSLQCVLDVLHDWGLQHMNICCREDVNQPVETNGMTQLSCTDRAFSIPTEHK